MKNLRLHSCGVFSNVYRGTLISPTPRKEIAVKKTWPDVDANLSSELSILLGLSHEKHKNIVQILYTFRTVTPDKKICESMVFDYLPTTLSNIIPQIGGQDPDFLEIKLYTWQLFNGLAHLCKNHICHRDIKPQNLLIEPMSGILKIADFGSAKIIRKTTRSSSYQVTRFYRPPELLLEATFYSPAIDVWSGGCVLGEITRGSILFPGRDTKHQLKLIVDAIGSPDDSELVDMKANTHFAGGRIAPRGFEALLPHASNDLIDILQKILVYPPKKRLCGKTFLSDQFFQELFVPKKRRRNGSFVSCAITPDDLSKVPSPRRQRRSSSHHMEHQDNTGSVHQDLFN